MAILTLYRSYLDKAIENCVQQESAQNLYQMAALKFKMVHAKKELGEEKSRMSSYLAEMEELRMTVHMQNEHQHHAEAQQCRAEKERKEMADQLVKAIEDRTCVEDLLMVEQERGENLSQDLVVL